MAETKTTTSEGALAGKPNASATNAPKKNTTTAPMSLTDRQKKIMNIASIGSSVGFISGLGYAFSKKKGFWSYVGYGLLGSIVFGTVSGIGARVIIKKDE